MGDYGEPDQALADIPRLSPDVLLLDLDLGKGRSGIELGLALWERLPDLGILVLSNHVEVSYLAALPEQEGRGWSYLIKKSVTDLEALARAIRGTAKGFVVLDPEIARTLGKHLPPDISAREREVMELLAQGYSNATMASRLCVSEKTVEIHVSSLYKRLGIDTRDHRIHPRVRAAALCLQNRMRHLKPSD